MDTVSVTTGAVAPRSILVRSILTSLLVIGLAFVAMILTSAPLDAATCTWAVTGTGGPYNWTTPTNWAGCGTGYPGQTTADAASFAAGTSGTIFLNTVVPQPVTIVNLSSTGLTFDFQAGGAMTLGGTSSMNQGTIQVNGGAVTIPAGAALQIGSSSGQAFLQLNSGSITNSAANGLNITAGSTFASSFQFSGGLLNGSGTTLIAGNGPGDAVLNFTGTSVKTIDAQTIDVVGNVLYPTAATAPLTMNNGAAINISSTGAFTITNDLPINTNGVGPAVIRNSGTFTKNATSTVTNTTIISPRFDNSNTVNVTAGGLELNGGGNHSGTSSFATSFSLPIDFAGAHSFAASSTSTWSGTSPVRLVSGTLTLGAGSTINATRFVLAGGQVNGSGLMNTSDSLNGFLWSGGSIAMTGAGTIDLITGSAGTFNGSTGPLSLTSGTLLNHGSVTLTADIGGTGLYKNVGSTTKTSAGITTISPAVENSGTMALTSGTLRLAGGGTHTGNFDTTVTGTKIEFSGGTHNFTAGTVWGGMGGFAVTGGTADIDLNLSLGGTVTDFLQSGGVITGAGTFTINKPFVWSGGTMDASGGAGSTVISAGSTVNTAVAPVVISGRQVTNANTMTYSPTGTNYLSLNNGAVLLNGGAASLFMSDGQINTSGVPSNFNNAGTIFKNIGTSSMRIDVPVTNSGSITANSGTIIFAGGGSQPSGSITAAATGTNIHFSGGTYSWNGGSIGGTGTIAVLNTGTLDVGVTASIPNLSVQGVAPAAGGLLTLNTPNTLTVTNLNWSGGRIQGSGTLNITNGTVGNTGPMQLNGGLLLRVNGTMNYGASASNFLTVNSSTILVPVGGTFNIVTDAVLGGSAPSVLNVLGTLARTGGTGTATISVPVTNAGALNLNTGTTAFGNYSQTSGAILTLAGGNFSSASPLTIGSGSFVTGVGTITAPVSNAGTLEPNAGASPGQIVVNGAYTQTATGSISVGIQGAALHDSVAFSTAPTLAGNFSAALDAYSPAGGETFNVLTWPSAPVTNFTTYSLPSPSWQKAITSSALALYAFVGTADLTVTNVTSGTPHTGDNVVFTITVTNTSTSDTAGSVALTNVISGPATVVSATTTVGSCTAPNCTIGTLAPGANAVITLTVNATGAGTITNTASVTSGAFDPNTANNTNIAASAVVTARADLAITSTDTPDPVNATGTITYTVTLTNAGPDAAASTSVSLSTANGTITSVTAVTPLTCTLTACTAASLPTGSYAMTVTVTPGTAATTSLTATASSTTFDNSSADNSTTQTTAVTAQADVEVLKSGPATAVAGNQVVYTIKVKNIGPSPAASVTVSDPTPANTTFVSNSGDCTSAYPCSLGTMSVGQVATITSTYTIAAGFNGTISNTASATAATADPATGNNAATVTTTVGPKADLSITKSGPAAAGNASTITYSFNVTNNGPSVANAVQIIDNAPSSLGSPVFSGVCSAFPCALGNLNPAQSVSFTVTYTIVSRSGSIVNTASVTSSTPDVNSANNSSTVTTTTCPTAPVFLGPADGTRDMPTSGRLEWNNAGAPNYRVYLSLAGSGCSTLLGETSAQSITYSGLQSGTAYQWRVESLGSGGCVRSSTCITFVTGGCNAAPPTPLAPLAGAAVSSPATFQWTAVAGATSYTLYFVNSSGASAVATTTATTVQAVTPADGSLSWYVVAALPCGALQSSTVNVNICNRPDTPKASIVGQATSGQNYLFEWNEVPGAVRYEVDEADNVEFRAAQTTNTTTTSVRFVHRAEDAAIGFYYRVRAFSACDPVPSPNSFPIRVVIVPIPKGEQRNPSTNVPFGTGSVIVQQVFIAGEPNQTLLFTATTDRPWLSVSPATGTLPPEGITLEVRTDPAGLPNGTSTASVIVTVVGSTSGGGVSANDTSAKANVTKTVPVSVNLVTPVSPVTAKPAAEATSAIIPSVGHIPGLSSLWQSDIRLTNTLSDMVRYQLTFTPSAGTSGSVKQTTVTVEPGGTTALDDIIRNWFGIGSLGDSAMGALEIKPLDQPSGNSKVSVVASSRTYNQSSNGTLGQYVPAIPFASFIGKSAGNVPNVMTLQQISQSAQFRTNVGVVEGAGKPANVLLSIFDKSGTKLKDVPLQLAAGEQRQLNALLAANDITLDDGRIEVKVTDGEGKVTAYASVVDNNTQDPLLVPGTLLGQPGASRYVLPGAADITNELASWRTDMRVFNASASAQNATLTFYPQNGGAPNSVTATINPGEVRTFDNLVNSLFGQTNIGGAVHINTPAASSLVVTGRTYNKTPEGTYGQFIPAVTAAEGTSLGGRALNILQVEESTRYRTNLGLAEITGKPVTVEVQVILPDSKVTPIVRVPLAANEFRQFAALRELGVGNVYNARLSVRVVSGEGAITAYGSVIDMTTQDPTYVPAQ